MAQMISISGRHKDIWAAKFFFDLLARKVPEEERDIHPYNALMNAYGRVNDYNEALKVLEVLRSKECLVNMDKFSYSTGMSMAVKASR